jgi:2-hydroxy-6-oxonona-2,4-dienedioate hydrolase
LDCANRRIAIQEATRTRETLGRPASPMNERWADDRVGPWQVRTRVWAAPSPEAPLAVLVHGFVISSRYLVPTGDLLAAHARVEAPDLPGFGRSGKPHDMLDIDGLADALARWMDERGHDRAHLLGNSMGCQVIAAFAQRHPGRVDRIVLLGPTTDRHTRTVPRQAALLAWDMTRERWSLPWAHVPDYLRTGPRRILQLLRHVMGDAIEARMPDIESPTLILRGARDTLVSQRFVDELAALAPRASVRVIPGAPHAANYSAPREVARAALPFLLADEKLSRPARPSRRA